MRFRHYLAAGRLMLALCILLTSISLPALAQETTATPIPPSEPLTLVWQTLFTPDAMLLTPSDIAVSEDGSIYVSAQGLKSIKKFDADGNFVLDWGKTGAGDGDFSIAAGIATDAQGNVYVADFSNIRIEKFDSSGKFLMSWKTESPRGPASIIIAADGTAYVDNFGSHKHYVQKFDSSGALITQWGSTGKGDSQFGATGVTGPEDIALDTDGNVYVSDRLNHRVQKFDPDGNLLTIFGGADNDLFDSPLGLALDGQGNIYVVDMGSKSLKKLDPDGNLIAEWSTDGGDLDKAAIVAVDSDSYLYLFANTDATSPSGAAVNVVLLKKFQQPQD
jgi:DNA-binding beta-propeller fold protein YncE